MKKFFDYFKFKSVEPEKKLTEDTSTKPEAVQSSSSAGHNLHAPSEGAQRAGAAALARNEQHQRRKVHSSQDVIRNRVKRELEAEAAALAEKENAAAAEGSKVPVKDPGTLSVSGVDFTCPLPGATLTKSEREVLIKEAILMRFEEDPVEASVMMIHTFNKDREKVKAAVDIISKYVENICKNPTEEKYRKIKLSNKVFQEKVRSVEGSREFLEALGFISIMLPVDGQAYLSWRSEEEEEFLVLTEHSPDALELMKERSDRLQRGEPVRAQLDIQPQAFRASPNAQRFELPPEFYNLTAEELKMEQQQSTKPEAVQSSSSAGHNLHAPSEGAQRAGAAALARNEQHQRRKVHSSQDVIRNRVKRELEAEAAALAEKENAAAAEGSKVPVKDPGTLSVSGVDFTCPLPGATLTKSEREVLIKEAILMRFEEDPVEASVMMIHTFNKDREKVKAAVDIISKYVENICKNPTEEKYRKIKLSNKVFQEKVRSVEGSREFLEALGFISIMLPVDGQAYLSWRSEEEEEFLVLTEHSPDALELMKERSDRLQRGEPVRAQLDIQPQAFRASPNAQRFELPPEFYNPTAEELKMEQQQRGTCEVKKDLPE